MTSDTASPPPSPATGQDRAPKAIRWLATGLGAGLSPVAPGTMGALIALPPAWVISWLGGPWLLLGATAVIFALGVGVSDAYRRAVGRDDPGEVVIDEVAGQWLTLVVAPLDPIAYAFGFLAFRVFDIAKPWPVGLIDRRVGGGLGIMADDIAAGALAGLALTVFLLLRSLVA